MILGLNPDSVFGSWSFKRKDETHVYKCIQKPLIHNAKFILEILLVGSWSFKLPGFECFCMILGLKSRFSFWILILQTSWFTAYLHDFGTKSRFSFGILILQTTWFTANLYDFGTKSRFSFRILILQKKGWDKCLQKPLIHDAKLILEILLFGAWSSKLPGFECFLHDLGTKSKSRFRFGTPYPPNQLHDFGTKSRFSILILQTTWFTVYLHALGSKSRFSFWILILQTTWFTVFAWSWD